MIIIFFAFFVMLSFVPTTLGYWTKQSTLQLEQYDDRTFDDSPLVFNGRGAMSLISGNEKGVYIHYSQYNNGKVVWSQQAKLKRKGVKPGPSKKGPDRYGHSVDIDGAVAVVSDHYDDTAGENAGAAYIFGGEWTRWSHEEKLIPNDARSNQHFGKVVRVSGNCVLVGALDDDTHGTQAGAAYSFLKQNGTWSQQQKLFAHDEFPSDHFGGAIEVYKELAIISSEGANNQGTSQGSVYVFQKSEYNSLWSEQQKLVSPDPTDNEYFGLYLSIYDTSIAVGSPLESSYGDASGTVYIFKSIGPPISTFTKKWSFQQKIYPSDSKPGLYFGSHVSLFGSAVSVGALGDSTFGRNFGATYVFVDSPDVKLWVENSKLVDSAYPYFSTPTLHGSMLAIRNSNEGVIYSMDSEWKCLLVSLEDQFGDGWGTLRLRIDAPDGTFDTYTSYCEMKNPFQLRYCPLQLSDVGNYHLRFVNKEGAEFAWEAQYSVQIEGSKEVHHGDVDTEMDFRFNPLLKQFEFVRTTAMKPHLCPKCKPKPKPVPGMDKTDEVAQFDQNDDIAEPFSKVAYIPHGVSAKYQPITVSMQNHYKRAGHRQLAVKPAPQKPVGKAPPKPAAQSSVGVPAYNSPYLYKQMESYKTYPMEIELADQLPDSWFQKDGSGTSYYVSDSLGLSLFTSGSICGDSILEKCSLSELPDGQYLLRVGGGIDSNAGDHTWKFCGHAGGAKDQLEFIVVNGRCSPMLTITRTLFCSKIDVPVVVLEGHLLMSGLQPSTVLTAGDEQVLNSVIASYIPGLELKHVHIDGEKFSVNYGEELAAFTTFVPAKLFGYHGRSTDDLMALTSFLNNSLHTALSSGQFVDSVVRTSALWTIDSNVLTAATSIELMDLTLVGVDNVRMPDNDDPSVDDAEDDFSGISHKDLGGKLVAMNTATAHEDVLAQLENMVSVPGIFPAIVSATCVLVILILLISLQRRRKYLAAQQLPVSKPSASTTASKPKKFIKVGVTPNTNTTKVIPRAHMTALPYNNQYRNNITTNSNCISDASIKGLSNSSRNLLDVLNPAPPPLPLLVKNTATRASSPTRLSSKSSSPPECPQNLAFSSSPTSSPPPSRPSSRPSSPLRAVSPPKSTPFARTTSSTEVVKGILNNPVDAAAVYEKRHRHVTFHSSVLKPESEADSLPERTALALPETVPAPCLPALQASSTYRPMSSLTSGPPSPQDKPESAPGEMDNESVISDLTWHDDFGDDYDDEDIEPRITCNSAVTAPTPSPEVRNPTYSLKNKFGFIHTNLPQASAAAFEMIDSAI